MIRGMSCCLLFVLLGAACSPDVNSPAGTVIVNARVIDGSGGPSREVSVRIVGERIDRVGMFEPASNDTVVDAAGLVLAPGFIDTHSHHEDGLLEMRDALAVVSQGVTTIAGGQDGGSLYPLADFYAAVENTPATCNVASFVGHGTLRAEVMGEDYQRHASDEEITAMVALLRQEMAAGALGLSSGLEYDPGSFSNTEELITLAREAASHGGRYITHIRSEDQYFWEAIDEAIRIGREAELPVQVTHIKLAMTRWWGQADRLQKKLDEARESGVDITADIYPYRAWTVVFSWLRTLFPERDLDRRDGAVYVLRDMLSPEGILIPNYVPDPVYSGMTVAEIAEIREMDAETTLMDLLKADVEMGGRSSMLGFAMHEPDIESIMAWPHTVIASDGELMGPHPRGFGAFTRVLGHYIRARNVVSLEEGIKKMTSQSAAHMGIAGRGAIVVGHYADLVLFDAETVADRSTPEEPHNVSTGIDTVWVNGEVVFADGEVTASRPGKVVRRP